MKTMLKKFVRTFSETLHSVRTRRRRQQKECDPTTAQLQLLLYHSYRDIASRRVSALPTFAEVGFRCHSQFEEDGILLYIFALIGTTNRVCVEICAGNGVECSTANLILHHGWWGYLFDGNDRNVTQGVEYYRNSKDTWLCPPTFTHAWITRENVNDVIRSAGVAGDIDLLSLDIDGMDYWVWKAIDCIRPRVVVCETHNAIGAHDSLTVPYDPNFKIATPGYHSASLAAMTALAEQKGYRLVGTHRYGFNAFFVLKGLGEDRLLEVTAADCLTDPCSLDAHSSIWPKIRDMDWTKV